MRSRRRGSIRSKLFLTYSAVLCVIVLGFATALYAVLLRTYSDTMRNNQVELTSQMISIVDSFMSEMDTVALVAAGTPRLLAYYIDLADKNEPGNYFERNLIDGVDAGSLLANINGRSHTVDRISVYNEKNDYVSAGILYETKKKNGHDLPVTEWIESAKDQGRLVVGPHNDYWSDSSEPLISVIRPLSNNYGAISYGIVEVQRRFSKLEALLSFETQQSFILVVFDQHGAPLYMSDADWRDTEGYGERVSQAAPMGIQSFPTLTNGYAAYGRSSLSQWSVMLIYSRGALYQTYKAAFTVLAVGTLLLLMVLVILVYFIADRLSRPIRKLSASIQNIDLQNLRLDFSDLGQNEIDDIQLAFDTFVSRLSHSAAMEMEAHMLALQSQINPHFLYNSLAVISAAGYEGGNEEVTDMCTRLASMLRYAASHSTTHVTLADELDHMRAYLELMKKRYEKDFIYDVNVSGDTSNIKTPKLILQPIVENCFKHGFKDVAPPWRIDVLVEISDTQWKAIIADDGVGMPPQEIESVNKRLEDYRLHSRFPKLSQDGSGMINTAARLFLTYGGQGFFSIDSQKNFGTKVTIGGSI